MWLELPFNVPVNNQIVWIRIDRWSGSPFKAKWKTQGSKFISVDNLIKYPAHVVSVWKGQ